MNKDKCRFGTRRSSSSSGRRRSVDGGAGTRLTDGQKRARKAPNDRALSRSLEEMLLPLPLPVTDCPGTGKRQNGEGEGREREKQGICVLIRPCFGIGIMQAHTALGKTRVLMWDRASKKGIHYSYRIWEPM